MTPSGGRNLDAMHTVLPVEVDIHLSAACEAECLDRSLVEVASAESSHNVLPFRGRPLQGFNRQISPTSA